MFSMFGLLAVPALIHAASQQELTLQQVLKANTAAINAIRSIHVTIEVSSNAPVRKKEEPLTEAQPTWRHEWCKDGARERSRDHWLRGGPGKPSLDASNGSKGYKALHNYDPNNPPSESSGGHCGGELDKTQPVDTLGSYTRAYSYMQQGGVKLEEYMAEHPEGKLAATPATSQLGCYEISLLEKLPKASGSDLKDEDIRDLRIFVDPKVGFWIRRIERGPSKTSSNPRDKGTFIGEVQEFKDCGNGIFWPERIYQRTRWPGQTWELNTLIQHTLHSINQPLQEQDFQVHFPDWLVVYDKITGQVFVWGPDDKPRMTFASKPEFSEWNKPRAMDQLESGVPNRSRWIWLAGISIIVGLMLAFIIWRRSKPAYRLIMAPGNSESTLPSSES